MSLSANTPHIVFCVNREVLAGLHVALYSSLLHYPEAQPPPCFHIYHQGLSSKDIDSIDRTLSLAGKKYQVRYPTISVKRFEKAKTLWGSHMPYARLLIPDQFDCERFLYLDADILVTTDLFSIYNQDLGDQTIGVVAPHLIQDMHESAFYAGLSIEMDKPYFNSGVMLVDVLAWKKSRVTERCLDLCEKYPEQMISADQSVLNAVMYGGFHELNSKYNYYCPAEEAVNSIEDGILHFIGSPKPWDPLAKYFHKNFSYYREYSEKIVHNPVKPRISLNGLKRSLRLPVIYLRKILKGKTLISRQRTTHQD